jgi:adenosylmethionine-8-amino-7-oxononanoate aminotransferase
MRQAFIGQGVWLRPFGDVLYIMPSFIISEEELKKVTDAVLGVV